MLVAAAGRRRRAGARAEHRLQRVEVGVGVGVASEALEDRARGPHPLDLLVLVEQLGQRLREGAGAGGRREPAADAVLDHVRLGADRGRQHRQPGAHRLEHGVGADLEAGGDGRGGRARRSAAAARRAAAAPRSAPAGPRRTSLPPSAGSTGAAARCRCRRRSGSAPSRRGPSAGRLRPGRGSPSAVQAAGREDPQRLPGVAAVAARAAARRPGRGGRDGRPGAARGRGNSGGRGRRSPRRDRAASRPGAVARARGRRPAVRPARPTGRHRERAARPSRRSAPRSSSPPAARGRPVAPAAAPAPAPGNRRPRGSRDLRPGRRARVPRARPPSADGPRWRRRTRAGASRLELGRFEKVDLVAASQHLDLPAQGAAGAAVGRALGGDDADLHPLTGSALVGTRTAGKRDSLRLRISFPRCKDGRRPRCGHFGRSSRALSRGPRGEEETWPRRDGGARRRLAGAGGRPGASGSGPRRRSTRSGPRTTISSRDGRGSGFRLRVSTPTPATSSSSRA